MQSFSQLAYEAPEAMIFGRSVRPVTIGFGLRLGAGQVVPELKYLPRLGLEIDWDQLQRSYRRITVVTVEQALALGGRDLMLELEQVPEINTQPEVLARIVSESKALLAEYFDQRGLHSALRVTLTDTRPPEAMHGREARDLLVAAEAASSSGADVISVESVGGVEVFGHAVARGDIAGVLFAVGVLGCLDMAWLWPRLVGITGALGIAAGGDAAGATANTALFLAGGQADGELGHCFAAVTRAAAASRSLVAFEAGATGPDKDAAFEGIITKAIVGRPTSMQSRALASHETDVLGRMPCVACDLWSNEVIEYVGVGGGGARVYTGILEQDTAQFNVAAEMGIATELRDRIIQTERHLDPQALILAPDVAIEIARAIVAGGDDYYARSRAAMLTAIDAIEREAEPLALPIAELKSLDDMKRDLEGLPDDAGRFVAEMLRRYGGVTEFRPECYGFEHRGAVRVPQR